jgi:hypothetical protein
MVWQAHQHSIAFELNDKPEFDGTIKNVWHVRASKRSLPAPSKAEEKSFRTATSFPAKKTGTGAKHGHEPTLIQPLTVCRKCPSLEVVKHGRKIPKNQTFGGECILNFNRKVDPGLETISSHAAFH